MTRAQIELCAKGYIALHIIVFIIYCFKVLNMFS